jgi:hypothetical protein
MTIYVSFNIRFPDTYFCLDIEPVEEILIQSTSVYNDCVPNLLKQCKSLFKRVDLCSNAWSEHLNSRVPSMQSLMKAILFKRSCTESGLRQEEIVELLRFVFYTTNNVITL